MFCDGSTLVILTSPAGTSTSTSATRSLFGGTLSGLRCKTYQKSQLYCLRPVLIFPLLLIKKKNCMFLNIHDYNDQLHSRSVILMQGTEILKIIFNILVLASNMCFNVETGQFNTRSDLSDAPTCALGRGAPLQGLGKCQGISCGSGINVHLAGA